MLDAVPYPLSCDGLFSGKGVDTLVMAGGSAHAVPLPHQQPTGSYIVNVVCSTSQQYCANQTKK